MSMLYWLHEGITHVLSDLAAVVPAVTVHAVCASSEIWACSPAPTSPGPTVLTASRPAPQVRTAASTPLPGGIRKEERRKTSLIPPAATSLVSGRPPCRIDSGRPLAMLCAAATLPPARGVAGPKCWSSCSASSLSPWRCAARIRPGAQIKHAVMPLRSACSGSVAVRTGIERCEWAKHGIFI